MLPEKNKHQKYSVKTILTYKKQRLIRIIMKQLRRTGCQ